MFANASLHTFREGIVDEAHVEVRKSQSRIGSPNFTRSPPVNKSLVSACREIIANSNYNGESRTDISSLDGTEGFPTPRRRFDAEGSFDERVESSSVYPPDSYYSTRSSNGVLDIAQTPSVRSRGCDNGLELGAFPQSNENLHHLSPPRLLVCAEFRYVKCIYVTEQLQFSCCKLSF